MRILLPEVFQKVMEVILVGGFFERKRGIQVEVFRQYNTSILDVTILVITIRGTLAGVTYCVDLPYYLLL